MIRIHSRENNATTATTAIHMQTLQLQRELWARPTGANSPANAVHHRSLASSFLHTNIRSPSASSVCRTIASPVISVSLHPHTVVVSVFVHFVILSSLTSCAIAAFAPVVVSAMTSSLTGLGQITLIVGNPDKAGTGIARMHTCMTRTVSTVERLGKGQFPMYHTQLT